MLPCTTTNKMTKAFSPSEDIDRALSSTYTSKDKETGKGKEKSTVDAIHTKCESMPTRPLYNSIPSKRYIEDYKDWIGIAVEDDNSLVLKCSQRFKKHKKPVLIEACNKIQELLNHDFGENGSCETVTRERVARSTPHKSPVMAGPSSYYRSKSNRGPLTTPTERSLKRQRERSSEDYKLFEFDQPKHRTSVRHFGQTDEKPLLATRICDAVALTKWFDSAFRALQQTSCRLIAKIWIKRIHPKKQSTHPYNGAFPRDGTRNPERTKPRYWPPNVQHKEPDHVDRNARVELLVWLVTHTGEYEISSNPKQNVIVTASDLRDAIQSRKSDFSADRWTIIEEIIATREKIEAFEDGGCDSDFVLYLTDFGDSSRDNKGAGSVKDPVHDEVSGDASDAEENPVKARTEDLDADFDLYMIPSEDEAKHDIPMYTSASQKSSFSDFVENTIPSSAISEPTTSFYRSQIEGPSVSSAAAEFALSPTLKSRTAHRSNILQLDENYATYDQLFTPPVNSTTSNSSVATGFGTSGPQEYRMIPAHSHANFDPMLPIPGTEAYGHRSMLPGRAPLCYSPYMDAHLRTLLPQPIPLPSQNMPISAHPMRHPPQHVHQQRKNTHESMWSAPFSYGPLLG